MENTLDSNHIHSAKSVTANDSPAKLKTQLPYLKSVDDKQFNFLDKIKHFTKKIICSLKKITNPCVNLKSKSKAVFDQVVSLFKKTEKSDLNRIIKDENIAIKEAEHILKCLNEEAKAKPDHFRKKIKKHLFNNALKKSLESWSTDKIKRYFNYVTIPENLARSIVINKGPLTLSQYETEIEKELASAFIKETSCHEIDLGLAEKLHNYLDLTKQINAMRAEGKPPEETDKEAQELKKLDLQMHPVDPENEKVFRCLGKGCFGKAELITSGKTGFMLVKKTANTRTSKWNQIVDLLRGSVTEVDHILNNTNRLKQIFKIITGHGNKLHRDFKFDMGDENSVQILPETNKPNKFQYMKPGGVPLAKIWYQENPFSFKELRQILKPLIAKLNDMHKRGIAHGDISTDNIVMDQNNELRYIDFDHARYFPVCKTEEQSREFELRKCSDRKQILRIIWLFTSVGRFSDDNKLEDLIRKRPDMHERTDVTNLFNMIKKMYQTTNSDTSDEIKESNILRDIPNHSYQFTLDEILQHAFFTQS